MMDMTSAAQTAAPEDSDTSQVRRKMESVATAANLDGEGRPPEEESRGEDSSESSLGFKDLRNLQAICITIRACMYAERERERHALLLRL